MTQDGRQYQVFVPPGPQPASHRRLLLNPFNGVVGVNPELLSIRQLVGIADEEGSGCNDAEARGPPRGHWV